jgi:dTMP kinase
VAQHEPRRGLFITVEGPEGSGKTTQAERLRARLERDGHDVVLTREPGGTRLGERVRAILLEPRAGPRSPRADALLFSAARAQLVAEVVRPALDRGAIVVSTRFADSTLAYQGYGSGVPIDELRSLERVATGGLRPALTILLDLPVEAGLGRKTGDEVTRFEAEFDLDFHRRVRAGFLELAAAEPGRFVVVDGSGGSDDIAEAITTAVVARLAPPAAVRPQGREG